MANVTIAGVIYTIDDPDHDGMCHGAGLQKTEFGILIEFESAEELRQAIITGKCSFTIFGEKA